MRLNEALGTTAVLFLLGIVQSSNYLPILLQYLVAAIAITAAALDFRSRQVPNWLTLSGLIAGIAINSILYKAAGVLTSLEGIAAACLIYLPLYLLGGIGGGDVKLMAAIGALVGPGHWLLIFVFTALFGGAAALLFILFKKQFGRTILNVAAIVKRVCRGQAPYRGAPELDVRTSQGVGLPHAIVIACGALAFLVAQASR